jgi:hypothetical protein
MRKRSSRGVSVEQNRGSLAEEHRDGGGSVDRSALTPARWLKRHLLGSFVHVAWGAGQLALQPTVVPVDPFNGGAFDVVDRAQR